MNEKIVMADDPRYLAPGAERELRLIGPWASYRRKRILASPLWLVPVLPLGWLAQTLLGGEHTGGVVAMIIIVGWASAWCAARRAFLKFRCPRCGRKFMGRDGKESTQCAHCALPLGAQLEDPAERSRTERQAS
jgi:hypothetical protein